ncbi:MAG: phosphoenolpyruvate-utilizing N-terminal domain-containing protein [Desulfobia sp.]
MRRPEAGSFLVGAFQLEGEGSSMGDKDANKKFFGKTISPGLGYGKTFIYRRKPWRFNEIQDIEVSEIEAGPRRFELAVAEVLRDLKNIAEQVAEEIDEDLSPIFQAHMAMVSDKGLNEEVKKRIREEQVSAGSLDAHGKRSISHIYQIV